MPELESWVIDTSPILALIAALGDLRVLQQLYSRVIVPLEVCEEILVESAARLGAEEFEAANWLEKRSKSMTIQPPLSNLLDKGEASVIQLALNEGIQTVCIDEAVGRRIARLSGLRLTGSIGILIKAKQSKAKQSKAAFQSRWSMRFKKCKDEESDLVRRLLRSP